MLSPIVATVTLTSEADRAAVWNAFERAERWPEVLADLSSARLEPAGALASGTTIRTEPRPDTTMLPMAYHVLIAEPERRLVLASRAAGFAAETEYALADDPAGGACVDITARVTPEGTMMRLSAMVWRRTYVDHLAGSLRRRMGALLMLAETIARERASLV